jgi:hypothetical protein
LQQQTLRKAATLIPQVLYLPTVVTTALLYLQGPVELREVRHVPQDTQGGLVVRAIPGLLLPGLVVVALRDMQAQEALVEMIKLRGVMLLLVVVAAAAVVAAPTTITGAIVAA